MNFDWDEFINNPPEFYRLNPRKMSESDRQLKAIWNCAFPDRLNYAQVLQLIYLMYEIDGEEYFTSFRGVSHMIGIMFDLKYDVLLGEVYGINEIEPDDEIIAWLRKKMSSYGYYDDYLEKYPIVIEFDSMEHLGTILQRKMSNVQITLEKAPLHLHSKDNIGHTLDQFVTTAPKSPETWTNIRWQERDSSILWDDITQLFRKYSKKSESMSPAMAAAHVSAILKAISPDSNIFRLFTDTESNLGGSSLPYWLIVTTHDTIGLFGIEET